MALQLYRRKQQEIDDADKIISWQTKYVASNLTNVSQDIAEVQFNNLTIGRTYLLGGSVDVTENNNILTLNFRSAASNLGDLYHQFEINTNTIAQQTFALNKRFIATSTSMYVYLISIGSTILHGDGTVSGTHIQLVEKRNDVETISFN